MAPLRRLQILVLLALVAAAAPSPAAGIVASSPLPADTVQSLVRDARSLEAGGRHREAARAYLAAAERDPGVARWLRLSALVAAGRGGDTLTARRLAGELRGDAVIPRDSVRAPLARALFRAGAADAAVEAARGLPGEAAPRLWVEHLAPALLDRGDTTAARNGLRGAATSRGAPAGAMERLLELEPGWQAVAAGARADLREGRGDRGRRLLERALATAPVPDRPGLAVELAEALLAAGRPEEAHRVSAEWLGRDLTASVRARLELVAARSHFRRGQTRQGSIHLRRGAGAGDVLPAARAGYLRADLAHDRGDLDAARARYGMVARDFPRTRYGGLARMRLGFLALAAGDGDGAAGHFRAYRGDRPGEGWHTASLYWEGRAREAAGDSAGAVELYRRVRDRDPVSYYGMLAAREPTHGPWLAFVEESSSPGEARGAGAGRRRGTGPRSRPGPQPALHPPGRPGSPTAVDALLGRMDRLRELGWRQRALRELEAARREAESAAGGALALSRALHREKWSQPGIGLGWQAFQEAGGEWSRPLLEAVFPLPYAREIRRAAGEQGVSAALVAAVARQESSFDPGAESPAGAVGLMQLMPPTAHQLARRAGRARPDSSALRDREVSLALGTRYLGDLLERFDGSRPAALIAYNAGPHRYERWRRYPEFRSDRELMVERIPFAETRRYVKSVLRNVGIYRELYGLDDD
jgi:soluble lytic murein transglycosylase